MKTLQTDTLRNSIDQIKCIFNTPFTFIKMRILKEYSQSSGLKIQFFTCSRHYKFSTKTSPKSMKKKGERSF